MRKKIISNTYYVCLDNDLRETKISEITDNDVFLFYGSNSKYDNFVVFCIKENSKTRILEVNYQSVGCNFDSVKDLIEKIKIFKQQNHE